MQPRFVLLGGPNGSGKSTFSQRAAGRANGDSTDGFALGGGARVSVHTTLSGNREARVKMGGHAVPEEDIRRRYFRSLDNVRAILPMSHAAASFDHSGEGHRLVGRYENGALEWRATDGPGWLSRVE